MITFQLHFANEKEIYYSKITFRGARYRYDTYMDGICNRHVIVTPICARASCEQSTDKLISAPKIWYALNQQFLQTNDMYRHAFSKHTLRFDVKCTLITQYTPVQCTLLIKTNKGFLCIHAEPILNSAHTCFLDGTTLV